MLSLFPELQIHQDWRKFHNISCQICQSGILSGINCASDEKSLFEVSASPSPAGLKPQSSEPHQANLRTACLSPCRLQGLYIVTDKNIENVGRLPYCEVLPVRPRDRGPGPSRTTSWWQLISKFLSYLQFFPYRHVLLTCSTVQQAS